MARELRWSLRILVDNLRYAHAYLRTGQRQPEGTAEDYFAHSLNRIRDAVEALAEQDIVLGEEFERAVKDLGAELRLPLPEASPGEGLTGDPLRRLRIYLDSADVQLRRGQLACTQADLANARMILAEATGSWEHTYQALVDAEGAAPSPDDEEEEVIEHE